jgi:hypothetical protein
VGSVQRGSARLQFKTVYVSLCVLSVSDASHNAPSPWEVCGANRPSSDEHVCNSRLARPTEKQRTWAAASKSHTSKDTLLNSCPKIYVMRFCFYEMPRRFETYQNCKHNKATRQGRMPSCSKYAAAHIKPLAPRLSVSEGSYRTFTCLALPMDLASDARNQGASRHGRKYARWAAPISLARQR